MRGSARSGWSPQPSPPTSASASSPSSSRHASTRRGEVLARLERPDPEHGRAAEVGRARRPARARPRARVARATIRSARDAERLGDVAAGEGGVREDDVARARGVRAPCACASRRVRGVHHSGMVERDEVVEHGRAHAAALRRVHPVGEEEARRTRPTRRSTAGRPSRLQAVRSACEAGSGTSRGSTGMPVERLPDRAPARAGSSARTRRPRAAPARGRDEARRASRGCSSRSRCADARAARRRRRSSCGSLVGRTRRSATPSTRSSRAARDHLGGDARSA